MKINRIFFQALCAGIAVPVILFIFPAFAQTNPKLSDPEVATVAMVANQIDISYAEIAKKKSKDAEVLKFAQTMINDHTAVIDQFCRAGKKIRSYDGV